MMYGKGRVEVLVDKTLNDLNVCVDKLSISSHQNVYVECVRCGEQFTREYRHHYKYHSCSIHITKQDGCKQKWCNKCENFLPYNCFDENIERYDGLSSYCKTCGYDLQTMNKLSLIGEDGKDTLSDWIIRCMNIIKHRCEKSGTEFIVDFDYLFHQWSIQHGKCYYSKIPMSYGVTSLKTAWIERIVPTQGYVDGNVVWVTTLINNAKGNASDGEFLELMALVKNGLSTNPIRLECKKLHPDAQLPSRSRGTDAGYDLYSYDNVIIPPHSSVSVNTGIALAAPPEYYYTIEGRSGLGVKGIIPFRGIIDAGYTGQVMVMLRNGTDNQHNVQKYDRIAQICLHRMKHADIIVVDEFSHEYNQRGISGFGSSGR